VGFWVDEKFLFIETTNEKNGRNRGENYRAFSFFLSPMPRLQFVII
jgi:hypothetical protein